MHLGLIYDFVLPKMNPEHLRGVLGTQQKPTGKEIIGFHSPSLIGCTFCNDRYVFCIEWSAETGFYVAEVLKVEKKANMKINWTRVA